MEDIFEAIKDIKNFRKSKAGKCLSTSHDFTAKFFADNIKEFMIHFSQFDIKYKENIVRITIPMGI